MAFEDVATLLLRLEAENNASPKIDEAKRSIEEYAAAVDAAAASVAAASASMDASNQELDRFSGDLGNANEEFRRFSGDLGDLDSGFKSFSGDLSQAGEEFQRFTGDLGALDDHAELVRQEMDYLASAVGDLHKPMSTVKQDMIDLDSEFPKATSEAERVRAAMADLHDEEEQLAAETAAVSGVVNRLSGDLQQNTSWWGKLAGQQGVTTSESEKLHQGMSAVDKVTRDVKDSVEEADGEVKRIGPDMDRAMGSAQRLTRGLLLLGDASRSTSNGFGHMRLIVVAVVAGIALLTGALGGVLALGVPAFFLVLGGGAALLKQNLDKLQASGQKLTATQKAELAIVTPLANAFAQLKPVIDKVLDSLIKWEKTLGPALAQAFSAMGPMLTMAGQGIEQFIGILVNNFAPMMKQIQPVMQAFWDGLSQVANGLVGMMEAIDFKQAAQGLTDFFHAVGTLLVLLGQLITALSPLSHFLLGEILPAVVELAGGLTRVLGGALKAAGPALSQFAGAFAGLVTEVLPLLAPLGQLVGKLLPPFLSVFTEIVKEIAVGAQPIIVLVSAIMNWISASKGLSTALGIMIGVWVALRIAMMANPFVAIITIVIFVAGLIITHWTQIKDFLLGIWHDITGFASSVWGSIKGFFVDLWAFVSALFFGVWTTIKNFFVTEFEDIVEYFVEKWTEVKNFLSNVWTGIRTAATNAWNAIKDFFINIIANIIVGITTKWTEVKNWFSNLWSGITALLSGAKTWLLNVGSDIIHGLWQGIQNAVGWLWGQIKNIGSGIVNEFKSFLNIFSPSKTMADEVGRFIPEGIAQGILDHASVVSDAAKKAAQGAVTGAQVGVSMIGSLSPGNAIGAGASGGNIYLTFTGNQVMNSASIQELADKAGQQVARYMLPAAGRFIHS